MMFQSPCGVLGVCRCGLPSGNSWIGSRVSVPLRGFRGLQEDWWYLRQPVDRSVSVPLRGFRGLQGNMRLLGSLPCAWFQSPCGVLGVCRSCGGMSRTQVNGVSVPLRGFRGLQAVCRGKQVGVGPAEFQSPCGVLGVCRSCGGMSRTQVNGVSVPLRGFRGLQEKFANATETVVETFQSPCGVLGVCRHMQLPCMCEDGIKFQSPCGVLGVCRRCGG